MPRQSTSLQECTSHLNHSSYSLSLTQILVPYLCLRTAAANGNICLVQYALSHGKPINSVLYSRIGFPGAIPIITERQLCSNRRFIRVYPFTSQLPTDIPTSFE